MFRVDSNQSNITDFNIEQVYGAHREIGVTLKIAIQQTCTCPWRQYFVSVC